MAKCKRHKAKGLLVIKGWADADNHLKRLGELDAKLDACQAEAKRQIDHIKANLKTEAAAIQENIKLHTESLEAYCASHRDEVAGKSRKLNFGTIGWRRSSKIHTKKDTLELLKSVFGSRKAKRFLRITEAVDKKALAKLRDEELAAVNARREEKDVFFAEPDNVQAANLQ